MAAGMRRKAQREVPGRPAEELGEPLELHDGPGQFRDLIRRFGRIALAGAAIPLMTSTADARVNVRTVGSSAQVKPGQMVLLNPEGDYYGPVGPKGGKRIAVFSSSAVNEMLAQGVLNMGVFSSDGGTVKFFPYVDSDVEGPLLLVPGEHVTDVRNDLVTTGSTKGARSVFRNVGSESVDVGGGTVWGPYFFVDANKVPQVGLSGGRSLMIDPADLQKSNPLLLVDIDLRRGEVPLKVLEERERQAKRALDESLRQRSRDIRDSNRWMQRQTERAIPRLPHGRGPGADIARQMERDMRARMRQQTRDQEDAAIAREKAQRDAAVWSQQARLADEKERRRMLDQVVVPIAIIAAGDVIFPERGNPILPEGKLSYTYQVTGDPEVVEALVGRNISQGDMDAISGRMERARDIQSAGQGETELKVTGIEDPAGFYVVRVGDLKGTNIRGAISVSRGALRGPFHFVPADAVAPELDETLYRRYYSDIKGPVPVRAVEHVLYQMADTDGDNFVTAGDMWSMLDGYNTASVARMMRALAGDYKPQRYIEKLEALGSNGGFVILAGSGSVIQTGEGIPVYGSYAAAYAKQLEYAEGGTPTTIVGSVEMDPQEAWRWDRAFETGSQPVLVRDEKGRPHIVDVPVGQRQKGAQK